MFRRAFLAGGAGVLLAAPALAAGHLPAAGGGRVRLSGTYVTAVDPAALAAVAPRALLTLRRDPTRRFEPATAVAVLAGERHLGYLPGTSGKLVAPLLDNGIAITAEAVRVRPGERPVFDIDLYLDKV
jgi:hypothetical protein